MRIKCKEVSRTNVCMDQTQWPTFCNRNHPDCLQQPSRYHRSWIIAVLKNNKLLCETFLVVSKCGFYVKTMSKENVWWKEKTMDINNSNLILENTYFLAISLQNVKDSVMSSKAAGNNPSQNQYFTAYVIKWRSLISDLN